VILDVLLPAASGMSGAVGTARSVYLKRQLDRARRHPVTGLPTRDAWTAVTRRITQRRPETALVLLIDLDRFKQTNDTYGHAAGDAVLAVQAERIRTWCGPAGRAGHFGGDEFAAVALIPASAVQAQLSLLAAALREPVTIEDTVLETSASVGAAQYAELAVPSLPQALHAADLAMYTAKRTGCGYAVATQAPPFRIENAPVTRVRHHGPEATR
jgi:diguanylate cyclase (GGDEF)-like protein